MIVYTVGKNKLIFIALIFINFTANTLNCQLSSRNKDRNENAQKMYFMYSNLPYPKDNF